MRSYVMSCVYMRIHICTYICIYEYTYTSSGTGGPYGQGSDFGAGLGMLHQRQAPRKHGEVSAVVFFTQKLTPPIF